MYKIIVDNIVLRFKPFATQEQVLEKAKVLYEQNPNCDYEVVFVVEKFAAKIKKFTIQNLKELNVPKGTYLVYDENKVKVGMFRIYVGGGGNWVCVDSYTNKPVDESFNDFLRKHTSYELRAVD